MQEFLGVVAEKSTDTPVVEAVFDGGRSLLLIKDQCQISAGDVIFGPLQSIGDRTIYNKTRRTSINVHIFLVRRDVGK